MELNMINRNTLEAARAISNYRDENKLSLEDIGNALKIIFDEAELTALINELNKGKL